MRGDLKERAIVVVRDEGELLPLAQGAPLLIVTCGDAAARDLAEALRQALGGEALALPLNPGEGYARQTLDRSKGRVTLLVTSDAPRYEGQVFLARVLQESGARLIVVGADAEADLAAFPRVGAYIAAAGADAAMARGLVAALTGGVAASFIVTRP